MPSDEELEAMTGVNPFIEGAVMDKTIMDSWLEQGFTREEAFELLLVIKNKAPYTIIIYDGDKPSE
jgi:hypothetical protein